MQSDAAAKQMVKKYSTPIAKNNLAKFDSATAKQMMKMRNEIVLQKNSCKFDSAAKQSKATQNKTKQIQLLGVMG